MTSKKEMIGIQSNHMDFYDNFCGQVMKMKGVRGVGFGFKEVNNTLTNSVCYRVYVNEKLPKSEISKKNTIPKELNGFEVDVIRVYNSTPRAFTERRDKSKHRPLTGGIAVGTEKTGTGYGTLGWFGTLNAGGDKIFLTNDHVLFDNGEDNTSKIAQPTYSDPCCCECGVIGTNIIGGRTGNVDCAIGRINNDIGINLQLTNASTSRILIPSGNTAQAVVGEQVVKIGARSGYTQGTVIDIGAVTTPANTPVDLSGNPVAIIPNQILILPIAAETYEVENGKKAFSNAGDSGSVILNSSNDIVGLLYAGNWDINSEDITFANNISNVMAFFNGNGNAFTFTAGTGTGRKDYIKPKTYQVSSPKDEISFDFLEEIFNSHQEEVLHLVNTKRETKIAWQRFHGPAIVALFYRGRKYLSKIIPAEVNGIKLIVQLKKIEQLFLEYGSNKLKSDINIYSALIYDQLDCTRTYKEFYASLQQAVLKK